MENLTEAAPTPDFSGIEAALIDACTLARDTAYPLTVMLRLYRSVAGLARALMQARADAGLPLGLSPNLIALLDVVRETACEHVKSGGLPVMDSLLVYRAIESLATVAHRASHKPAAPRTARQATPTEAELVPPPPNTLAPETLPPETFPKDPAAKREAPAQDVPSAAPVRPIVVAVRANAKPAAMEDLEAMVA